MESVVQLVLDTSVTMIWGFEDEQNSYAEAVLTAILSGWARVPTVWPLEVGNALIVGERRNRISAADSARFAAMIAALPIVIDYETPDRAMNEILGLARRHDLSTYDAAYLELAMRLGLPLATLDRRLRDAATTVGVELYTVI